jgi:hypothetical protein
MRGDNAYYWLMRGWLTCAAAIAGTLVLAPAATADHHLVSIREVFPGSSSSGAAAEFVELQMYAPGQDNFAPMSSIDFYGPAGTITGTTPVNDVASGANQSRALVGTTAAEAAFGVMNDTDFAAPSGFLDPAGGAVCFESTMFGQIDCVAWGAISGPPGSAGTPAAAIPDGSSLLRSICAGSATELEAADDTNDSAADFAPTSPTPQNNAAAPGGGPCSGNGGGGGGGGGGDNDPPQTKIKQGPKGKVDETTVKFKFKSDEPNSTFECKIDRKKFKPCKSPKKVKRLDEEKHKFLVRATDAAGNTDPSPAKRKFEVVG